MLSTWIKQGWFHGVLVGLGSAIFALVLWATPVLQSWEYITWGWRVTTFAKPSPATDQIKLILIDQYSLDWGASVSGWPWPWPRQVYEAVINFCRRGGARVIAFDMLYSEPSMYFVSDDVMFGEAIGQSNDFVLAFFMGHQAGQTDVWPDHLAPNPVVINGLSSWLIPRPHAELEEPRATFPVSEIARNVTLLANVKDVPDTDGTFRRVAPFRVFDGTPVPFLGLGAYLVAYTNPPYLMDLKDNELNVGQLRVPLDDLGRAILNFRGRSGTHESFSAAAIIQSEIRLLEGGTPVVDPSELAGKYVLFGVSAPALKDLRPVPISGDYPGVEIHATFLDNLLAQDFMRDAHRGLVILSTLILAILAGVLIVKSHTVKVSVLWAALFLAIPMLVGYLLYLYQWWWPIMVQEIAILLAVGLGEIINYATEGRQKRFIKSAFKQYLSGDVIEQILHDPTQLKLGGEKRELSIFFSDLQGFSGISEKLGPVALTALLNDYLTDMSDIIMEEGGTVDKYEGDAIIAFWNAPLAQADHAIRACRASLRCQRKLAERRREFLDRTGAELFMRIGIHTGEVVVGNMGSKDRFNYTVLGDAANLAARLEGANKQFGTYLMVSEVTWNLAKEHFHAREIGAITVVGRKAPVRVYDVLAMADEPEPPNLESWRMAMICISAGQWEKALSHVMEWGDDILAGKYRRQLEKLISGELKEWNGIWSLSEK